jgi:hypothetical protein
MQDIAELGVPAVKGYEPPTGLSQPIADPVTPSTAKFTWDSNPAHSRKVAVCAMCGDVHQGTCGMTDRSENLAHYRQLLFTEQSGDSFEDRVCPLSTPWLCSLWHSYFFYSSMRLQ